MNNVCNDCGLNNISKWDLVDHKKAKGHNKVEKRPDGSIRICNKCKIKGIHFTTNSRDAMYAHNKSAHEGMRMTSGRITKPTPRRSLKVMTRSMEDSIQVKKEAHIEEACVKEEHNDKSSDDMEPISQCFDDSDTTSLSGFDDNNYDNDHNIKVERVKSEDKLEANEIVPEIKVDIGHILLGDIIASKIIPRNPGKERIYCNEQDCALYFFSKIQLNNHKNADHVKLNCPVKNCGLKYQTAGNLEAHLKRDHGRIEL